VPLASFIVPCFNEERYIRKCIISLLNQSFHDFEILFIDDGSTDRSLEIVESFRDDRIKILNQRNHGRAVARNKALAASKAKYVILQDADDWSEPERLEEQINCAENSSGVPVVGCGYFFHKENDDKVKEKTFPLTNSEIRKVMSRPIFRHALMPPTMLTLRDQLISNGGWRPKFVTAAEDGDLISRLFEDSRSVFSNVPRALYHYRLNPGSVTNKPKEHILAQMFKRHCDKCRRLSLREPSSFEEYLSSVKQKPLSKILHFGEFITWYLYMKIVYH
jgi:glycosyltransferase involved in cell wall biosynthesis